MSESSMFDTLRDMSILNLRSLKSILSDAKEGTKEYRLFHEVCKALDEREKQTNA